MNRRDFIKHTAVSGIIMAHPTVAFTATALVLTSSGGDDTHALNAALRASARAGIAVRLEPGSYKVTNSIVVPPGGRLIGRGLDSPIEFAGGQEGVVIRIEEPHANRPVQRLIVEDHRFSVPFVARLG